MITKDGNHLSEWSSQGQAGKEQQLKRENVYNRF